MKQPKRYVLVLAAALLALGCGGRPLRAPATESPPPIPARYEETDAQRAAKQARAAQAVTAAQSWSEFRTQAEARPPAPYRLDNGDVLALEVYSQGAELAYAERLKELSVEYTVAGDGTIHLPYHGKVAVRGLTLAELETGVGEVLATLYQAPRVLAALRKARVREVTVNGFPQSGRVPITPHSTLLDVLTLAGWDLTASPIRGVLIIRGGRDLTQVNLDDITERFELHLNVRLQEDDIIIPAPSAAPVRVTGEVRRTGAIVPVARTGFITVARALSAADGVTTTANLSSVRLLRADGGEEVVNLQHLLFGPAQAPQPVLYSGDELYVPASSGDGFYVFGTVGTQGFFPMEQESSVLKALAQAAVDAAASDLSKVVLLRSRGAGPPEIYHIRADDLLAGDASQNMSVRTGDVLFVPKTGTAVTLDFINRLLAPLSGSASFGLQVQQALQDARR